MADYSFTVEITGASVNVKCIADDDTFREITFDITTKAEVLDTINREAGIFQAYLAKHLEV